MIVDCCYITTICNDAASEHLFFEHDLLVFPRTRIARRAQVYGSGLGGDKLPPSVYTAADVVENGKRRPRASDRNNRFLRMVGGGPTWPRKRAGKTTATRVGLRRGSTTRRRRDPVSARWLDKRRRAIGEEEGTGMRRGPRMRLAPPPYPGRY